MRKILVGLVALAMGLPLLVAHLFVTGNLLGIAMGAALILGGGQSLLRGRRERAAVG